MSKKFEPRVVSPETARAGLINGSIAAAYLISDPPGFYVTARLRGAGGGKWEDRPESVPADVWVKNHTSAWSSACRASYFSGKAPAEAAESA
jgi:hypothetical protein